MDDKQEELEGFWLIGVNTRGQQLEFYCPARQLYALVGRSARGWDLSVGGQLHYAADDHEIRTAMEQVIPDACGTFTSVFAALDALLHILYGPEPKE